MPEIKKFKKNYRQAAKNCLSAVLRFLHRRETYWLSWHADLNSTLAIIYTSSLSSSTIITLYMRIVINILSAINLVILSHSYRSLTDACIPRVTIQVISKIISIHLVGVRLDGRYISLSNRKIKCNEKLRKEYRF